MSINWRVAKSLLHLRAQFNATFPLRSKDSDGTIGDASHASRSSDHNPWIVDGNFNVVSGMDITHDPRHGVDTYALADLFLASKDKRIKYIISNRRIAGGSDGPSPWKWRKYTGASAHDHHMHFSVKSEKTFYDNETDWTVLSKSPIVTVPVPTEFVSPLPKLFKGMRSDLVGILQERLNASGEALLVTKLFDDKTDAAVRMVQSKGHLGIDGIVGPMTWKLLGM